MSHPVWVRGLKHRYIFVFIRLVASHPVWVRGLKPIAFCEPKALDKSHPVWVRGLKHVDGLYAQVLNQRSRTPCGCVD